MKVICLPCKLKDRDPLPKPCPRVGGDWGGAGVGLTNQLTSSEQH